MALGAGRGWLEATAGIRGEGPAWLGYVRGEVGASFAPGWATFAALEATAAAGQPIGWTAMAGVRGRW